MKNEELCSRCGNFPVNPGSDFCIHCLLWRVAKVTIGDLPRNLLLVTDSQEADAVRKHILAAAEFDSFFVRQEEGEYLEVWGFEGIVPWNHKQVWPILPPQDMAVRTSSPNAAV